MSGRFHRGLVRTRSLLIRCDHTVAELLGHIEELFFLVGENLSHIVNGSLGQTRGDLCIVVLKLDRCLSVFERHVSIRSIYCLIIQRHFKSELSLTVSGNITIDRLVDGKVSRRDIIRKRHYRSSGAGLSVLHCDRNAIRHRLRSVSRLCLLDPVCAGRNICHLLGHFSAVLADDDRNREVLTVLLISLCAVLVGINRKGITACQALLHVVGRCSSILGHFLGDLE